MNYLPTGAQLASTCPAARGQLFGTVGLSDLVLPTLTRFLSAHAFLITRGPRCLTTQQGLHHPFQIQESATQRSTGALATWMMYRVPVVSSARPTECYKQSDGQDLAGNHPSRVPKYLATAVAPGVERILVRLWSSCHKSQTWAYPLQTYVISSTYQPTLIHNTLPS